MLFVFYKTVPPWGGGVLEAAGALPQVPTAYLAPHAAVHAVSGSLLRDSSRRDTSGYDGYPTIVCCFASHSLARKQATMSRGRKLVPPGADHTVSTRAHARLVYGSANVRVFRTTTAELNELAGWLLEQGVESVAMESTYVYWIPVYELLESRGVEPVLVNARQLHNVPGRKTDFSDCRWLQLLHSCGLLRGSFRPGDAIVRMRALQRQMANLVAERTRW